MGLIQKVAANGILYSLGILFNRVVPEWLFRCRRFVILEMKPGKQIDSDSNSADDVTVKWCESEPDHRSTECVTGFYREKQPFDAKACMVVKSQRTIAGFWFAADKFIETELGVQYVLQQEQAWLFAARVEHEFRSRGVHQRLLKFMITELNKMGYTQILLAVNPNNKPSLHVHQKHANQKLGHVFAIRFLNLTICAARGDSISLDRSFSLNSRQFPVAIEFNT